MWDWEDEKRNVLKRWKIMARPEGSIGFGSRVGVFVGTLNEWRRIGIDSLASRGLETVFPPLVPIGDVVRGENLGITWDEEQER